MFLECGREKQMTRSKQELELNFGHEIINWEMSGACSTQVE